MCLLAYFIVQINQGYIVFFLVLRKKKTKKVVGRIQWPIY